jgi:TP901 family phage tail tape measure protein
MAISINDFRVAIRIDNSEAKAKFDETREQIAKVREEMQKLEADGKKDSAAYKELEKQQDKLNKSLYATRKEAGLTSLSYNELRKGARSLKAQMDNATPGTEKWKALRADYLLTKQRMKELEVQARDTKFSLSKMADGFNKYAAIGASAIASLTGVAMTARKCVDEFAEMQEAESQVRKYTGMTAEEVKGLNEEFKQMDTRTPREKLNALAGDAGRLGITAKKDVLEFVDAADKINVALGEDLGEDAVKNIGKLAQMFGEDEKLGLRGAMLATGSAINEVAQNSSAAEAYLVGFTARVAGAANQAKVAQGDILGYASVLDQNMQQQEMAATAFQTLMMKMFQTPAKFAKIAGQSVEEFTSLIKKDANEAMLQFLDTLNKKGGLDQLAPMFKEMGLDGVRASGVISTMAGKIDDIRDAQKLANDAYRDGTSIINEFNVQNNTVQAGLDKAKKNFKDVRVELGEKLQPVMRYMITTGSLTVKGLSAIVSVLSEYKGAILTAATAVTAYTLYVKAGTIATAAYNTVTKVATLATNLFSKATKASPWGLVIAGITAVVSYLAIFRDKTDESTESQKKFNDELERTKATMDLIAGVKVSADNFEFLTDKQKQQLKADAQRGIDELDDLLTKGMIETKAWYGQEKESILKATEDNEVLRKSYLRGLEKDFEERVAKLAGYVDKKKELEKIIAMVPNLSGPVVPIVDDEDKKPWVTRLKNIENAYKEELLLLRKKSDELGRTENEYQQDAIQKEMEYQAKRLAIIKQYQSVDTDKKHLAELGKLESESKTAIYDSLKKSEDNRLNLLKEYRDRRLTTVIDGEKKLQLEQADLYASGELQEKDYKNRLQAIDISSLYSRLEIAKVYLDDVSELEFQNGEVKANAVKEAGDTILTLEKQISEKRAEIVRNSANQIQNFNNQFSKTNGLASAQEQLAALETFYQAQLALVKKSGLDTTLIMAVYEEAKKKIVEKGAEDRAEVIRKYDLSAAEDIRDMKLKALDEEHRMGLLSEEEYEIAKNQIFNEYLQDKIEKAEQYFEAVTSIMGDVSSAIQGFQDAEISKVTRKYDKEIKAAKKAGKDTTKLEEEKEEAINQVKKKYADKQFAAAVLQVTATTAVAAMEAYKAMAGIPFVGPALGAVAAAAAIASGAAQIAVAKQQRDEAKGLKTGGYSDEYVEGYTRSGDPDDVAGVIPVHKNEFVANHESVANPHVRQFLDVFDVAQKNGTIRMINTTQILEQVRTRSGKYAGGFVDEKPSGTSFAASDISSSGLTPELRVQIIELMEENNHLLQVICDKELVVDSRKVRDGIRHIEKLERNVNR